MNGKVLLNWDDKSAEALINASSRSTSKVNLTGWSKSLEVTADGAGIVSHAGLVPVMALAQRCGLADLAGGYVRIGRPGGVSASRRPEPSVACSVWAEHSWPSSAAIDGRPPLPRRPSSPKSLAISS